MLNFKSDLESIHETLKIKKERSETGFGSAGSPTFELPQMPPPVTPKVGSIFRLGLFSNSNQVESDTKEDVKWHQIKTEDEVPQLESPPLSATVVCNKIPAKLFENFTLTLVTQVF